MATPQYDVFLSYNHKDEDAVKKIAEQLKNDYNIQPWLDKWELRPGYPWKSKIKEQIGQNKSAAIFVGKNSIGDWQKAEIDEFLKECKTRECPVIPVLLPDLPNDFDFKQLLQSSRSSKKLSRVFERMIRQFVQSLKKPSLEKMTRVDFRQQQTHISTEEPMDKLVWGITGQRPEDIILYGEDKYTDKKCITQGFFAKVYKAKNKSLGHDVVIKQLHYEPIKERFKETIKDAFTISNSSNFITIYDYCEYPKKHPFYVMLYIEGESLRKKLDKNPPDKWPRDSKKTWIEDVLEIVLKIGDALIEARKKINSHYHFNLKPSNIILDKKDEPFISAFNLCVKFEKKEIIEQLERLKTTKNLNEGKFKEELAYLLPEKFIKAYPVNEKTDQYMLGLLAYELLTGDIPPSIQDFETLKNDECEEAFPKITFPESLFKDNKIPEEYKSMIKTIIPKMTKLNPDDRYDSLEEALKIIKIYKLLKDTTKTIKLVKTSYHNCIKNTSFEQTFFTRFYEQFKNRSNEVEKIFSDSSKFNEAFWKNHHKLVEQTILLFFWYYEEKKIFRLERTIDEKFNFLNSIVESHTKINISGDLFDIFKDTLVSTISEYDNISSEQEYKDGIKKAWEEVLRPGFDYIKSEFKKKNQNSSDNIPIPSTIADSIS